MLSNMRISPVAVVFGVVVAVAAFGVVAEGVLVPGREAVESVATFASCLRSETTTTTTT
jgi:hypothetical protein